MGPCNIDAPVVVQGLEEESEEEDVEGPLPILAVLLQAIERLETLHDQRCSRRLILSIVLSGYLNPHLLLDMRVLKRCLHVELRDRQPLLRRQSAHHADALSLADWSECARAVASNIFPPRLIRGCRSP